MELLFYLVFVIYSIQEWFGGLLDELFSQNTIQVIFIGRLIGTLKINNKNKKHP